MDDRKFVVSKVERDLNSSGYYRQLVRSLIQFKYTKYFRDDLTLVFDDAQCYNSTINRIKSPMT